MCKTVSSQIQCYRTFSLVSTTGAKLDENIWRLRLCLLYIEWLPIRYIICCPPKLIWFNVAFLGSRETKVSAENVPVSRPNNSETADASSDEEAASSVRRTVSAEGRREGAGFETGMGMLGDWVRVLWFLFYEAELVVPVVLLAKP